MNTLTTLITGSSFQLRMERVKELHKGLPFTPYSLDGSKDTINIKSIREFQKNIALLPEKDELQRHFIIEAQNLSLPAQHALLKTLEEPPPQTQIIITADNHSALIETILSRCHHQRLETVKTTIIDVPPLLNSILTNNHAGLIELASKTKKETIETELDSLLGFMRQKLKEKPTQARAVGVNTILQAQRDLKTNGSQQLILEHLFFSLKSLTHR